MAVSSGAVAGSRPNRAPFTFPEEVVEGWHLVASTSALLNWSGPAALLPLELLADLGRARAHAIA